jgi:hypothetical protein
MDRELDTISKRNDIVIDMNGYMEWTFMHCYACSTCFMEYTARNQGGNDTMANHIDRVNCLVCGMI